MMTAGLSGVAAAKVPGNGMGATYPPVPWLTCPTDPTDRFAELVAAGGDRLPLDEACLARRGARAPGSRPGGRAGSARRAGGRVPGRRPRRPRPPPLRRAGVRGRPRHLPRPPQLAAPRRARPPAGHPDLAGDRSPSRWAGARGSRSRASGCRATSWSATPGSTGPLRRPVRRAAGCSTARRCRAVFARLHPQARVVRGLPRAGGSGGDREPRAEQPGQRLPAERGAGRRWPGPWPCGCALPGVTARERRELAVAPRARSVVRRGRRGPRGQPATTGDAVAAAAPPGPPELTRAT